MICEECGEELPNAGEWVEHVARHVVDRETHDSQEER